ncbi:MAG: ADP-ribose diphosphatase [SAR86 cluster bacterium]|uniref:ADP-ribose pyrophosphatase n=1 Tax=SAR86 cluster bacterium TaxID=2030880 RepID=A0A2A5AYH5_9GAMM|nr:MAG: ADP-ribose diphosphatase [SAR86 cluster bacterium]
MEKLLSSFDKNDVEVLSREKCHRGFLQIDRLKLRHRLFSGGWSEPIERELQCKPPAVGVLLYDPDRDEILLIRQFRVGMLDQENATLWPLEIVAGMVDEGEQLDEVAIREAQEESNHIPTDLIRICDYYNSPGGSNEKITLFCGRISTENAGGIFGLPQEHEDIEVVVISYDELLLATESGLIDNAMTIIAAQWLQLHKSSLLKTWNMAGSADIGN